MVARGTLADGHFDADLGRVLAGATDVAGPDHEAVESGTRCHHDSVASLGGLDALVHAVERLHGVGVTISRAPVEGELVTEDGSGPERTVPARLDLIILFGGGEPDLWRLLCHQNFLAAATGVTISVRIAGRGTHCDRLSVEDRERRLVKLIHRNNAGAGVSTRRIFIPHAMSIREFAVRLDLEFVALDLLSTVVGRRGPVDLL